MKTLYLLRHAHTTQAFPPLMGDHERILSPEGTRDALDVGRFMKTSGMLPDFILASSSVRTSTTARLIYSVLAPEADIRGISHFDRKFYNASAPFLLQEIQGVDDSIQKLMVVVHNPGVHELATMLSDDVSLAGYAPGTLSIFTADVLAWRQFTPQMALLDTVYVPKS